MVTYKHILNFPGYRVGSDGSIWSSRQCRNHKEGEWRKLAPVTTNVYGEQKVALMRNKLPHYIKVHHLVLETFVGKRPPGHEALHGDGHANNNALSNLRWGTKTENGLDTRRHGRKKGERHPLAKLTDEAVREIRARFAAGEKQYVIARDFGVHQSTISLAVCGRQWSHIS